MSLGAERLSSPVAQMQRPLRGLLLRGWTRFRSTFQFLRVQDVSDPASSGHYRHGEVRVVRGALAKMHEHVIQEGINRPEDRQNDGCYRAESRRRLCSCDDKGHAHENAEYPGKDVSL